MPAITACRTLLKMVGIPETMLVLRFRNREYRVAARIRDAGNELILFLHGLGCSKENWRDAWSIYDLRDMSLLSIDFPGFGHSPAPMHFGYTLQEYAMVLTAVIDSYALKRIHVVAHSMGGTVALLLPPRILCRLDSLILLEARLLNSSCGIAAEVIKFSSEEFISGEFSRIQRRISADQRAEYDLQRADPAAFYYSACSLVECTRGNDMLDRFDSAPCRKFFLYGADNRFLEEVGKIPHEVTMGIRESGHFAMRDNPRDFYRRIAAITRH